jgi:hypothetical protein
MKHDDQRAAAQADIVDVDPIVVREVVLDPPVDRPAHTGHGRNESDGEKQRVNRPFHGQLLDIVAMRLGRDLNPSTGGMGGERNAE